MDESDLARRLDIHVPAQAASLANLRRLLIRFLTDNAVTREQQQSALLVATELAANAIEHASRQDDELDITVVFEPHSLLIRVLDPARTGTAPVPLDADESSESGRGMLIVSRLARWSERQHEGRREVSAELPLGDRPVPPAGPRENCGRMHPVSALPGDDQDEPVAPDR